MFSNVLVFFFCITRVCSTTIDMSFEKHMNVDKSTWINKKKYSPLAK